jgi:class III cytochrome C family protein
MATPGRTQKQIAERYKGNLGYYKRKHPWRVARFTVSFLALAGGLAAIIAYQSRIFRKQASEEFFSSGRISSHHAKYEQDCAQCHDKNAAMGNDLTFARFKSVIKDRFHHGIDFKSIDHKCEECHEKNPPFGTKKEYDLHEPNVVENRACSICHQEHLGPGPMKKVADSQCASCHGDRAIMEASAKKGTTLKPEVFHLRPQQPQQIVFERPRPAMGYTQVFSSFHREHPEFQLIREKAPDPDTLRFNHARHFASDIPPVKGQKLDCNYCHKPDPQGRFYERINFAAHCQACHALQFDERNPKLHLPHGEVNLVRTFLRTLPAQYAELARTQNEKPPGYNDVKTFIAQQMNGLRRQFGSDAAFENAVFLEIDPYKKEDMAPTKANFSGCAHCHAVKIEGRTPVVTKPYLVDRWMPQANFNHAKHASVSCEECHAQARQSKETSQVLMPDKAKCVACHSPETKKVSSDCITCHTYHAPGQLVKMEVRAEAPAASPFKQMLLRSNR